MKKILRRIVWLGRGTATMMGVALMVAIVLGTATTALAAVPGDPFRLGKGNLIDAVSVLVGTVNNAMLRIDNDSDGASATALDLRVEPGKAPMKVDSATKVANLNSDRVDGKSANELVRVASFTGISSLSGGNEGTVATTTIDAPASGFLVIDAGSSSWNRDQNDEVQCFVEVDNAFAPGSDRWIEHNGASNVNQEEDCSTNAVVPVAAGTHTVDLEARSAAAGTNFRDTALSAIYVPFNGAGA